MKNNQQGLHGNRMYMVCVTKNTRGGHGLFALSPPLLRRCKLRTAPSWTSPFGVRSTWGSASTTSWSSDLGPSDLFGLQLKRFLIANIVTTSKALVTRSDALVTSSFLLLLVRHLLLEAMHLLLVAYCFLKFLDWSLLMPVFRLYVLSPFFLILQTSSQPVPVVFCQIFAVGVS